LIVVSSLDATGNGMSLLSESPKELFEKLGDHPDRLSRRGDEEWRQYRIHLGEQTIGIEVSSIDHDQLRKGRIDHAKESEGGKPLGARCMTSLEMDPRKRSKAERTKETRIITPGNVIGPTCSEFNESWLDSVWNLIVRKTADMEREDYRRGDKNWLLLTDWFNPSHHHVRRHLSRLKDVMEVYWIRNPRFERVIVQTRDSFHFMITEDGWERT
jgi:hypothetical protein